MSDQLRYRLGAIKDSVKKDLHSKTKKSGWVLEKQKSAFCEGDQWTNIDIDVTPEHRRTWSPWTMLGFWVSDAMNAQGWQAPAAIIAVGLTWREAIYCIILGSLIDCIPLVLNGMIGAKLHVPFPVAARSPFGWYFSKFVVIVRMVTALFWHSIQTYTGSTAMTQVIRSIWPSYLNIPNHIPASVGITTQQMISHIIFWSIQFPIMLTPPHKIQWFFIFKAVVVVISSVGVVIAMTMKAGGTGDIWQQEATVRGSTKAWLILSSMSSITGGWATMATNVADFTRYLKKPRGVFYQVAFLPLISLLLGLFGIISTSSAKVVYGEYIWDPLALAAKFDGPAGRCGAFFIGFTWIVAQIGTNLSANIISFSNDAVSLCPKYINIRRGAIIGTVTAGWIMVPWKIIHSAASLLTFMSGLGIFLAPIAALLAADYWITKRQHIDVPSLYRRHGRYRYNRLGTNWRAVVAFLTSVVPNIPGLAKSVSPSLKIGNAQYIYDIFYLYGFSSAVFVYVVLSHFFPANETLVDATIHEDVDVLSGVAFNDHGVHTPNSGDQQSENEKGFQSGVEKM